MNKLPYLQPERELFLNLGIVVLLINEMAETKRGKKILTIEKLQVFYFLVTRPVFLNKILELLGKPLMVMKEEEFYNVDTLAVNLDELFDREKIKYVLKFLTSKDWLICTYDSKQGFLIDLNEEGKRSAKQFKDDHFDNVIRYSNQLSCIQSESTSKINGYINQIFKRGL